LADIYDPLSVIRIPAKFNIGASLILCEDRVHQTLVNTEHTSDYVCNSKAGVSTEECVDVNVYCESSVLCPVLLV